MRRAGFSLLGLFLIVDLLSAQSVNVSPPEPENLPVFRPILLGRGADSLVNLIDTQGLFAKGQKNGAIMFCCRISKTGDPVWSRTYHGTSGSKLLEDELQKRLRLTKFIPAVRNRQTVDAIYFGTAIFAIKEGKPHLRIFSNQQADELKNENDFIDPQPYMGADSGFVGWHYPDTGSPVLVTGSVELAVHIDAEGNLKELQVLSEDPPLLGFAQEAFDDFRHARFIPAFRDGHPVECNVKLPIHFVPAD
ncbi:MAG: energy transducer TonB [Chthoniobacterales bacterium]